MPHRIYQAVQQAHQSLQQIHEGLQQLTGMGMMGQPGGNMQFGGFTGAHSVMQPGFAGTDAQQVRQDIQNSIQNGSGMNMGSMGQQGGSLGQMGMGQQGGSMQFGGFTGGAHSVMQPGFAGTDAQQVRQDIQNSSNGQITSRNAGASMGMNANMQQGQMGMGQQGGSMQFGGFTGGPQSIMQPGFAGTDAQQVRQDIGNTSNNQGYMQ
ncbi:hypothetical protein V7128_00295 [Neobacillus vireti]|uniref:hypothetical protein n=1 Tax=Neobacillus vireti TaxID=220686 RepID=UPI002FFDF855